MNKLKAEVSSWSIDPNAGLIDGGILAKLHWPTDGLVKDLVDGEEKRIRKIIPKSDVFLIFYRYLPDSMNSDTQEMQSMVLSEDHIKISLNRDLQPVITTGIYVLHKITIALKCMSYINSDLLIPAKKLRTPG